MAKVITKKRRNAIIDMLDIHYTNCEAANEEYQELYAESAKILEEFISIK